MAARKKIRRAEAQLGFDALFIEGGLLSPEWLTRVAQLSAGSQTEADYRIEKGLNLRDEIGRYWRIAQAYWRDFAVGRTRSTDLRGVAESFVSALLRKSFEFESLHTVAPITLGDRVFPIGHAALEGRVPVVIASAGMGLDKLPESAGEGGRRRSAFGLAQEYLNAQEGALWGIASDGCTLRILRDNASLTRPAWIEADLERIFTEERYADFAALWLLLHETRFGNPGQPVTDCALETWRNAGREEGTRAREFLRSGVEEALLALGQGFLAHPGNQALRGALQDGSLTTRELFQQLLRLVYRMIFLLTVEERGLLHPEGVSEATRKLYEEGYSLRQLRERAARRSAHDRFSDRWEALKIVFRGLAQGEPCLGLPALAGLFAPHQCAALDAARLENRALLLAMFRLSWLRNESGLARVNWRDMGPEELGSVYESLLELVPQITDQGRRFAFATGGETKGNARKTTGSYYTPDSLVQVLLDSALEPVVADTLAANPSDPVGALLRLSVVDPACGSGHFLLGAARRLAVHVARLRANGTPSASQYRVALRDVVRRCIYGVDLNPMAVELCKVSLWMEALEPGLPLTFLDSHIQQGNSLLGTTPELMEKGIPDAAWDPIEGDDKKIASALKKRNKKAAGGQRGLDFGASAVDDENKAIVKASTDTEGADDTNVKALEEKERLWKEGFLGLLAYQHRKFVADAWCAAFVWPKQPGELAEVAPTNEVWRQLRDAQGKPTPLLENTVRELAAQYQFFHWHLQFPQVFEQGGFDLVLGNPPWENLQADADEFFASTGMFSNSTNIDNRQAQLESIKFSNPNLYDSWTNFARRSSGTRLFLHSSYRFPLTTATRLNTYAIFAELTICILRQKGRAGLVLPTGIATDSFNQNFFRYICESERLVTIFGFENEDKIFPGVHHSFKFALVVLCGSKQAKEANIAFYLRKVSDLHNSSRRYKLSLSDFALVNPNTVTCPIFKDVNDARIVVNIYQNFPILFKESTGENPWGIHCQLLVRDNKLNSLGVKKQTATSLPLLEGKMFHQFDHRFGTYEGQSPEQRNQGTLPEVQDSQHKNPFFTTLPQQWVEKKYVIDALDSQANSRWFFVWRDITSSVVNRTVIACVVPLLAANDSAPTLHIHAERRSQAACLLGCLNSFVFDFVARQKIGGNHLRFYSFYQLPILPPSLFESPLKWTSEIAINWFSKRILELSYTSWDLDIFAQDFGFNGPPFEWDKSRRFFIRCELDAAFFHLYKISRADVEYIMESFPIVRRNDEKEHGTFRTKDTILEIYDEMAEAMHSGKSYQTRLDPPPADPRVAHPPREGGKVIPLPVRPTVLPSPSIVPAASVVPDLATVAENAWTRPHSMERGEIQAALLAVLRVNGVPMDRRQVRLAALFSLEPHLLLPMLDNAEKTQWVRVIGDDAKKDADASIDTISQEWGAVISGLRGRGRLVEDLSQNTWAIGVGTESIETVGWPEGRANFVVNVVRRLQASTRMDAIILKLPINVQQWLANAA